MTVKPRRRRARPTLADGGAAHRRRSPARRSRSIPTPTRPAAIRACGGRRAPRCSCTSTAWSTLAPSARRLAKEIERARQGDRVPRGQARPAGVRRARARRGRRARARASRRAAAQFAQKLSASLAALDDEGATSRAGAARGPRASTTGCDVHPVRRSLGAESARAAGAPEGTVVTARHQTGGRGRRGRDVVGRARREPPRCPCSCGPPSPRGRAPQLSLVAGLAVADALAAAAGGARAHPVAERRAGRRAQDLRHPARRGLRRRRARWST